MSKSWPARYKHFPNLARRRRDLWFRPIRWRDREQIRHWRNSQMSVLRQDSILSYHDQQIYFTQVVRPDLLSFDPKNILVGIERNSRLIGYGGLVHICWTQRVAEVSFLTSNYLSTSEHYTPLFLDFLEYIKEVAVREVHLQRITSETYAFRTNTISALEKSGFSEVIAPLGLNRASGTSIFHEFHFSTSPTHHDGKIEL